MKAVSPWQYRDEMRWVRLMDNMMGNEMWDEMAIVRLEVVHMLADEMWGEMRCDTRSGPHGGLLSSVGIIPPLAQPYTGQQTWQI